MICNTKFQGKEIKISGVLAIPVGVLYSEPFAVYNHGTMLKGEEPSAVSPANPVQEVLLPSVLASVFKCAVLIPDYIGYGASKNTPHPYVHSASLGSSSLDFINAYIEYNEKILEQPIAKKAVIVGYSEGGYAAVALQKAIQESNSGLKVVKNYAGAGPYDNSALINAFINKNEDIDAMFFSSYLWVLSMYKDYMGYSKPYNQIYSATDNAIFAAENYDFGYLKLYPTAHRNPQELFLPSFLDGLHNATDAQLFNIIKENSLTDFVPADSLILFHSEADTWVYVENTLNAYDKMKNAGAPVRKEILPLAAAQDHAEASQTFMMSTFVNMFTTGVFAK
jgi:pimeloyl-ACP methyl ester carboxylesterase